MKKNLMEYYRITCWKDKVEQTKNKREYNSQLKGMWRQRKAGELGQLTYTQWFSILAAHWDHQEWFKKYWSLGATPRVWFNWIVVGSRHQDFEKLPRQFRCAARIENHCGRESFSQIIQLVQSRLVTVWSSGDKEKSVATRVCQSSPCPFSKTSMDPQELSSLVIGHHWPVRNQRPGGPA